MKTGGKVIGEHVGTLTGQGVGLHFGAFVGFFDFGGFVGQKGLVELSIIGVGGGVGVGVGTGVGGGVGVGVGNGVGIGVGGGVGVGVGCGVGTGVGALLNGQVG